MRCPECNTPNRDDAAFCGMCKRLFRSPPIRSSRPPPPPQLPPGGFWHALLERLSGAPPPPVAVDGSTLPELAAALQAACPAFWRSAELRVSLAEPAKSVISRGDDRHERLDLTPRLVSAIHEFARGHAANVGAGRAYLVVVERQPDGQWTMRCAVDSAHSG